MYIYATNTFVFDNILLLIILKIKFDFEKRHFSFCGSISFLVANIFSCIEKYKILLPLLEEEIRFFFSSSRSLCTIILCIYISTYYNDHKNHLTVQKRLADRMKEELLLFFFRSRFLHTHIYLYYIKFEIILYIICVSVFTTETTTVFRSIFRRELTCERFDFVNTAVNPSSEL